MKRTLIFDPKIVGLILVGISIGLFTTTFFLTQSLIQLRLELHKACPLPIEACPYKSGIPVESVTGFILAAAIGILGVFLVFMERLVIGKEAELKKAIKSLTGEEKEIYELLSQAGGSLFQGDLVKRSGYSKVRVSRILDRLETKGIVERRRRGMANLVILR